MKELIERLEGLTGPCRETDEAIYEALGNCNHKRYECYRVQGDSGQTCLDCGKDLYGAATAPRYTASIDAAMTLVPQGANWSIDGIDGKFSAVVNKTVIARNAAFSQYVGTPAIALCIAAIKAMTDTMQDGDRYE